VIGRGSARALGGEVGGGARGETAGVENPGKNEGPPGDPPRAVVAPVPVIERYLDEYSASADLPPNLKEAIRYSLLGPGKRLRPLLVWHCCAAVGGSPEDSLPASAAIEFIHAFSLVHDDLPGMDDDDLRRGRPTLHRHTTEAMAILAGDAMLTLAFQVILQRVKSPVLAGALVKEVGEGTSAMIAGQVYDTLGGFEPGTSGAQRLERIHRNKTGALIRASCRMGGLCGLGDAVGPKAQETILALTAYAEDIGLMFQIVDDLLDVTQTTAHLGKKANKDEDAGKLTYPGVHGIDRSRTEVRELHAAALKALEPLGRAAEPLREIASYMAVRTR
jgi:geranylgeranyl diphosphate synthase type II